MSISILFEDEHLIVCIKPPGVSSQPDLSRSPDLTALLAQQSSLPQASIGIVHRLDRPVGGIMVYTKTPQALKLLNQQLQQERFNKSYLALCCGSPEKPEDTWIDWLIKDGRTNTSSIVEKTRPQSKEARLSYRVVREFSSDENTPLAMLDIQLHTGRHHQIRVQTAAHQLPIWGDTKYNPAFQQKKGWFTIGLFAHRLAFKHPISNKDMAFEQIPEYEPFIY